MIPRRGFLSRLNYRRGVYEKAVLVCLGFCQRKELFCCYGRCFLVYLSLTNLMKERRLLKLLRIKMESQKVNIF
jgi:hypothetical protein